jgi:CHRD domain
MIVRLVVTAIVSLAIVACSSSATARTSPSATHSPSPKASPTGVSLPMSAENGGTAKGTVMLMKEMHAFSVRVHLVGLKPGSIHPSHIHSGTCGSNGPVVYPLQNVVANKSGDADITTMIRHPYQPTVHGWYVNVHQGPTMTPPGDVVIGCAELPHH